METLSQVATAGVVLGLAATAVYSIAFAVWDIACGEPPSDPCENYR